jgi:hypothetical protein
VTTTLIDADGNPPTIRRGTSPTFVFPIEDLTVSPTQPKNLTGASEVAFCIARYAGAQSLDLSLTLGTGTSHDGVGGNVTVVMTKEQTETLPYGHRWCELWITDNAGRRDIVGEGECVIMDNLSNLMGLSP